MKEIEEEVARLLDAEPETLPYLDELLADLDALGSAPEVIVELLASVGLEPGARVGDLGCGKGAVALEVAAALPVEVEGIDAFAPFIDAARKEARRRELAARCRFEVGDFRSRLDGRERFDVLVWASIGLVLGGVRATVERLVCAVRPGGWIVIDDCFLAGEEPPPPGYEGYLPLGATRAEMRAAGVEIRREVLLSADRVARENRRTTGAIRRRADELARRLPEAADLARRYVERQEAECRLLERHTLGAVWLLQRPTNQDRSPR